MRLKAAAKYFDDTPVYDAYTGQFLWNCQFSSFNDANAVGSTSTRRVLSIAPGLALPPRRAVRVFDDYWLVGDGNPDSWKGSVIRQSFNMKKATALVNLLTPGEACLGESGVQAFAQSIYFKDTVSTLNNADYDPFWNYFFSPTEPVSKGTFIRDGARLLRVRSAYLPLEDLRIGQSDEADSGLLEAVFNTGVYVPATDSYTDVPVATTVILLDFTKAFSYLSQGSEKVAAGDVGAMVAQSAINPDVGSTVSVSGAAWRIMGKDAQADAWLLHLRRA